MNIFIIKSIAGNRTLLNHYGYHESITSLTTEPINSNLTIINLKVKLLQLYKASVSTPLEGML